MELMVSAIRVNGDDNLDIELVDPKGGDLPPHEPGAHIDIRTPAGSLRQYSLCGPAGSKRAYTICVRRDDASRGGSRSLHLDLRVRAKVEVSAPRNLFPLPQASRYILLSAGIGITPIISMARHLIENDIPFELHHFEQRRARVAFLDELTKGPLADATTLHLGEDGRRFREATLPSLTDVDPSAAVLACGPNGFLDLLGQRLADAGWRRQQFHSERFRAEPAAAGFDAGNAGMFEIRIASTGASFTVGPAETIAGVLQANGVPIELSCEQGMCGACITRVVSGTPDHRCIVLSDREKERNDQMAICCSRSSSPVLVLDL